MKTDTYKSETAPSTPKGKRPVLTPSAEYVGKLRKDLATNTGLTPLQKTKLAAAPRTMISQIMTHADVLEVEIDKQTAAEAENQRKADFPWNKEGISHREWQRREKL